MTDQKNTILAIVLSALVLIGWQITSACRRSRSRSRSSSSNSAGARATAARRSGAAPGPRRRPARRRKPCREPPRRRRACRPPRPARPDPGGRAGGLPAGAHRDAERRRLDRAQGRAHRRSRADQISRDRRSEVAPDRAAGAVGQPASVLLRVRLGGGGGHHGKAADRGYAVAAGGLGRAHGRTSGHARLRQRRGARVPPHHRGRRQISLHPQGRGA